MAAKVVMIVSILLTVIGLAAGLFGYLGTDIKESWKIDEATTFPSPMALFGILAIVVGLFVMLTGLLGICAAKFKKCCFTMPFFIFCLIMTVLMLVVTLIGFMVQDKVAVG